MSEEKQKAGVEKWMMCSQHIGTIDDCKNQATMCYPCYLEKIKEFEKAVRNDERKSTAQQILDKHASLFSRTASYGQDFDDLRLWIKKTFLQEKQKVKK